MRLTHQQLQHLIGRLILEASAGETDASGEDFDSQLRAALKPEAKIVVGDNRSGTPESFIESQVLKNGKRVQTIMLKGVDPFVFYEGTYDDAGILTDIINQISPLVLVPYMCASSARDISATDVSGLEDLEEASKKKKKKPQKSSPPDVIKVPDVEVKDTKSSSLEMLGDDPKTALQKIAETDALKRMIDESPRDDTAPDYSNFEIANLDQEMVDFIASFDSNPILSQAAFKPAAGTSLVISFTRDESKSDDYYRKFENVFRENGLYDGSFNNLSSAEKKDDEDSGTIQSPKDQAFDKIKQAIEQCKPNIKVTFSVLEPLPVVIDHLKKLCKLSFYRVAIDGQVFSDRG